MTATTARMTPDRPSAGSRTFASLAQPNYRWYFTGALVSNTGTWMQRTSQDWLVLTQLTDHSSTALGYVSALQFLAIPFLAPFAGAIADRYPKRRVLLITQTLLGLNSLLLWLLVVTNTVELWHVYAFAFMQGIVASFDMPARQSFVSEMVSDELIPNAVGLNSMSFNAARLIGPGAAGLIIAGFGVAPGMLVNTLSFVAMLVALLVMDPRRLHPAPPRTGRGSAREGLVYIAHRPDIVIILVMVFMLGTFGMNFQIYNATMATMVFGRGASEYGALGTIMAIGTFGAAIIAARRRNPRVTTLLIGLIGFTVFSALLALAPSYVMYAFWLVPTGLCMLTVMTSANSTIQMTTEPSMRGRVMAVYAAINMGGTPLGAPIVGWVGDVAGPRWSILIGCILIGLTCLAVMAFFRFHRGVRLRVERGWPPRIHTWTPSGDPETAELQR
ncbi:MFS transporter [Brooklawnia cerclae]|uniref:MFS family permease n=1 Tax=Brooklawnia cerclae TaxID=349934 RepID=A0ABX0SH09_9ACTN|nr:MFS transporter [Brooklawnia cerclae]NIH57679.1 MFS family permease [Brooklawnia cerclae]